MRNVQLTIACTKGATGRQTDRQTETERQREID